MSDDNELIVTDGDNTSPANIISAKLIQVPEQFFYMEYKTVSHISGTFYDADLRVMGISRDEGILMIDLTEEEKTLLDESIDHWFVWYEKEKNNFLVDIITNASYSDDNEN